MADDLLNDDFLNDDFDYGEIVDLGDLSLDCDDALEKELMLKYNENTFNTETGENIYDCCYPPHNADQEYVPSSQQNDSENVPTNKKIKTKIPNEKKSESISFKITASFSKKLSAAMFSNHKNITDFCTDAIDSYIDSPKLARENERLTQCNKDLVYEKARQTEIACNLRLEKKELESQLSKIKEENKALENKVKELEQYNIVELLKRIEMLEKNNIELSERVEVSKKSITEINEQVNQYRHYGYLHQHLYDGTIQYYGAVEPTLLTNINQSNTPATTPTE